MSKSIRFLVLAVATALLPTAALAEAASTPEMRASLVITSTGSSAVALSSEGFELTTSGEQVQLTTTGSWVLLALIAQKPRTLPSRTADVFMKMQLTRPSGCAADGHCVGPNGYSSIHYWEGNRGYGSTLGNSPLRYPPGRYTAYLLTNPGSRATATIKARGAKPGSARVTASVRVPATARLASTSGVYSTYHRARADFRLRNPGFTFNRVWSMDDSAAAAGTGDLQLCTVNPEHPENQGALPPQDSPTCIAGGQTLGLTSPRSTSTTCDGGPGVDVSPSAPRDFDCGSVEHLSPGWYSVYMDGHRSGLRPVIGSVAIVFEFLRL